MATPEKTSILAIQTLVVNCAAHNGYRRAGFKLQRGRNTLNEVTEAQRATLAADPRLMIESSSEAVPLEKNLADKDLTTLKVSELKTLAEGLGVEGFSNMKKEDLIAAIELIKTEDKDLI